MHLPVLLFLSFGHLITDIHQGVVPTLMLYLRDSFNLSYAQVGLIILMSNLSSSVIQPLFGLYSDRSSQPWLMPLGIALAALGVSLSGVMPHFYLVVMIVFVSGLGIAAFHPEGSKTAHFAGGDRRASAMSIFSVGGNFGFALGPVLGVLFLGSWGQKGTLAFLVPGLATALAFYLLLPKIAKTTALACKNWRIKKEEAQARSSTGKKAWSWGLILLITLVIFRSWIQYGLISYLPFYYMDCLGGEKQIAAILVSIFQVSGAVGTLIGGPLADRFGAKRYICVSIGLMFPLLYLLLNTTGPAVLVLTALAGMVLISNFSPAVVMGQQYLPHHIGLASGLMFGFAVGMGGLGVPVLGALADRFAVDMVLKVLSFLPLVILLMALLLPPPPELTARAKAN